jgi:histidyl-tRNA synthetase
VNPRLVRGLDYYNKTVFEWVTTQLGAQGTVCAGGRYDGLVEQLGGKSVPAAGFAMGIERLVELVREHIKTDAEPHAYCVIATDDAFGYGMQLCESLREQLPDLRLLMHCGGGSFKSQFKRADKSGARLALIVGDDEMSSGTVGIKFLREDKPQRHVSADELHDMLKAMI